MSLAVLASFLLFACASELPDSPAFAHVPFDAALASAKKDGKVVMVDFFATWCGPCKKLDRVTWRDPKVIEWIGKKCVALKIDAEKEAELSRRYAIQGYPSVVFMKPDGTEIDRLVGYMEPDQFLTEAERVLTRAK